MIKPLLKFKVLLLTMLVLSSIVIGGQGSGCEFNEEATPCCFSQPLVEVKMGYFFFSDSKMRKVYDKGGLDIQLCASYPLWNLTNRWTLNAYGAVEYLYASGRSINQHQKTSLWSVPVNIGLKPVYAINCNLQYYFAIGPRYFYIHQHSNSCFVYKNKSRNGLGYFVNTGFNYALSDCLVIDIFGEYSYAKAHFSGGNSTVYTSNIQVGGFTFGAGLGYEF